MNFSVVINTVNRATSLQRTLEALRWQTHRSFEVIVVNGPSTDATNRVLSQFAKDIRSASCDEMNLSKSRNTGIKMASGDVVAFIDDDAIPEPDWLTELDRAYSQNSKICGAGGIVFDHTGCALQYQYSASDRVGRTRFDIKPPFGRYNVAGAEPFLYLQGTNMSFRREQLVEIGGFDEEIEYNFDEVEVCLKLIDLGYKLCPLTGAGVHHKYLASHVRNSKRLFTDPFFAIKNRVYFALRHGQPTYSVTQILGVLIKYIDEVKAAAEHQHSEGLLSADQLNLFKRQVDRGLDTGMERGIDGRRQSIEVSDAEPDEFLNFPTHRPDIERLRICFISQEYPPNDFGGIGRFTADLASGLASRGHEIHVVTRSSLNASVDFENGVWLHRIADRDHGLGELTQSPLRGNFDHIASVYNEVSDLHERRPLDLVSAPLWAAEGLICSLDPRLPTVTTLMTTMRTVAGLHKSWSDLPHIEASLRLEEVALESTQHIHAISEAILNEVRANFNVGDTDAHVVPLGARDVSDGFKSPTTQTGKRVTVLFVGRLEFRKGVDILLEAITRLVVEFPDVHFVLAGKDTINTELGESYRVAFSRSIKNNPELRGRVEFAGPVSDEDLDRLYATADIFCAPSRYESFGLVLLEAMRYGVPVIGCRAGGMPEIVDNGHTGLLAEPGDVDSLTQCLQILINDADRRALLGAQGRDRYERLFTLDVAVSNTETTYASIAKRYKVQNGPSAAEKSLPTVTERLSTVLDCTTDMNPVTARLGALRLLGKDENKPNPLDQLEIAWQLPTDDFIQAAYYAVLDQAPDDPGYALARNAFQDGMSRVVFVRGLARSHLAKDRNIDTRWLPELMQLAGDDYVSQLETVWQMEDEEFIACVYEILLRREVEESGHLMWLDRIGSGFSRLAFIQELTRSDEGILQITDLAWVEELEGRAFEWETRRQRIIATPVKFRHRVGRIPVIGNLFRRLVSFRRELGEFGTLSRSVSELSDKLAENQGTLTDAVQRIGHQISVQGEIISATDKRMDRLEGEVAETFEGTLHVANESQAATMALHDATTATKIAQEQSVERLDARMTRQGFLLEQMGQRIDVLHVKSEALSLDLREQVLAPREERRVERHVVDEESYRLHLDEMKDDIRINVGCGEKPLDGYLNIDFRELPNIDLVADARDLPFEEGTLAEIMSAHLVEHFRQHQFTTVILPHWRSLLRPGGQLRIICPNWAVMLTRVISGDMSQRDFKILTFGLQDYSGDDHFSMYTPESLTKILEDGGFDHIQTVVLDRQNGLCPEMELLAVRGSSPVERNHDQAPEL